jgi:hypothetical protein
MPYKYCSDCGESFHHDYGEEWKTVCIKCFKRRKSMERGESDPDSVFVDRDELNRLRRDSEFYRGLYFSLLAKQNGYSPEPPPSAGSKVLDRIKPFIKDLIVLCHPDRHGGNDPRAIEVTKQLLDLRREVSA